MFHAPGRHRVDAPGLAFLLVTHAGGIGLPVALLLVNLPFYVFDLADGVAVHAEDGGGGEPARGRDLGLLRLLEIARVELIFGAGFWRVAGRGRP